MNDAIEKKPPFEGKEKQSDKGFKDVLIFYSMISYAKKNKGKYYFWSKDNMFKGNTARDNFVYFKKETDCTLVVMMEMYMLNRNKDSIYLYIDDYWLTSLQLHGNLKQYPEGAIQQLSAGNLYHSFYSYSGAKRLSGFPNAV